jgi:hypothetical protein
MIAVAYALPVIPGREAEVTAFAREFGSRASDYEYRRSLGIRREAVFRQPTLVGDLLITYREFTGESATRQKPGDVVTGWHGAKLTALPGVDPDTATPRVEMLIRQRPARPAQIYAAALPLVPTKTARLHEFASELNGIHADEFAESLVRLSFGLTVFIQYIPRSDLVILVLEGSEPASALVRLAKSAHPFDRWHAQQIADQTGLDLSALPASGNELVWSSDEVAASPAPVGSEHHSQEVTGER